MHNCKRVHDAHFVSLAILQTPWSDIQRVDRGVKGGEGQTEGGISKVESDIVSREQAIYGILLRNQHGQASHANVKCMLKN